MSTDPLEKEVLRNFTANYGKAPGPYGQDYRKLQTFYSGLIENAQSAEDFLRALDLVKVDLQSLPGSQFQNVAEWIWTKYAEKFAALHPTTEQMLRFNRQGLKAGIKEVVNRAVADALATAP